MKTNKIIYFGLCIVIMLSLSGCKFPALFYKTPSLKEVQQEEIKTKIVMPDLNGLTYSQAVEKTDSIPLIVTKQYNDKVKKNIIFWQSVTPGEEISIGTPVDIVISKGIQMIEIPKVSDIISMNPTEGKKKPYGTTVKMTVDAVSPKERASNEKTEE